MPHVTGFCIKGDKTDELPCALYQRLAISTMHRAAPFIDKFAGKWKIPSRVDARRGEFKNLFPGVRIPEKSGTAESLDLFNASLNFNDVPGLANLFQRRCRFFKQAPLLRSAVNRHQRHCR